MVVNKFTTILLAGLIVSTAGCSGSRLRNMVTRADYSPIDELDATGPVEAPGEKSEAIAKAATADRAEVLVSQERELPEDDPAAIEKKRKGFFDFVKVFNRNAEDEFAPDPFAETSESEADKQAETKTANNTSEPEFSGENQAEAKADKFGRTMADVEKQSEKIFNEAMTERTRLETEISAADTEDVFGSKSPEEKSFAEFISQQKDNSPDVEKLEGDVANVIQTVNESKKTVSEFDAFLNESADTDSSDSDSALTSTLFPGLSEEFDAAFESEFTADPAKEEVVVTADPAGDTVEEQFESPFAEATRKHGFAAASGNDPWAAFGRRSSPTIQSAPQSQAPDEDEFAWGHTRSAASNSNESPFKTLEGNHFEAAPQDDSFDQAFLQVSSTRTLDTQRPIDISQSTPLVIPGSTEAPAPSHQFDADPFAQYQPAAEPSPIGGDPFLTSVPVFDQTAADAVPDAESTIASPAIATSQGGWGLWSRRTWFLLIGCVIVALLLFMPDRRNRTNV